ncbi:hypothetical protein KIH79_11870, partial [Bifidobacterium sp. 82T10]
YNSGGYLSDDPANDGASAWIHVAETGELTGTRPGRPDGSGSKRMVRGFVPYSGESALGYFGALRSAASFVMRDPDDGGLRGYGCELIDDVCGRDSNDARSDAWSRDGDVLAAIAAGLSGASHGDAVAVTNGENRRADDYAIRPTDGLRVRFFDTVHDWAVKLDRDALAEVRCATVEAGDESVRSTVRQVTLTIDNVTGDAHDGTLSLRMPAAGTYRLTVNGDEQSATAVQLDADWHRITVPFPDAVVNMVHIVAES